MKKKYLLPLLLLLAVTIIVAVFHRTMQKDIPCMVIRADGTEIAVTLSDLDVEDFSGELVDGKGTVTFHTYRGIELSKLLDKGFLTPGGATGIAVTSADNYTAEFTVDEILQRGRVYLAVTADGETIENIDGNGQGVQLVVFGDPNSRRCVRFATVITVK